MHMPSYPHLAPATSQAKKATNPKSPATTPYPTPCLLAAPVNVAGATPPAVAELFTVATGATLEGPTPALTLTPVLPTTPLADPEPGPVVCAATGTSPTSGGLVTVAAPVPVGDTVTNVTCGTVTAEVMTLPWVVWVNVTVVAGTAVGEDVGPEPSPETGGRGPRPLPFVTVFVTVPVIV